MSWEGRMERTMYDVQSTMYECTMYVVYTVRSMVSTSTELRQSLLFAFVLFRGYSCRLSYLRWSLDHRKLCCRLRMTESVISWANHTSWRYWIFAAVEYPEKNKRRRRRRKSWWMSGRLFAVDNKKVLKRSFRVDRHRLRKAINTSRFLKRRSYRNAFGSRRWSRSTTNDTHRY